MKITTASPRKGGTPMNEPLNDFSTSSSSSPQTPHERHRQRRSFASSVLGTGVAALVVAAMLTDSAVGGTVTIRSGEDVSPADGLDDNFSMLVHSGFGSMNPTAADFFAARTSSIQAFVLPGPPLFKPPHPDPLVGWLASLANADNPNSAAPSALMATSFTVSPGNLLSADLTLVMEADDGFNVYVNGNTVVSGGSINSMFDVAAHVVTGQNYLYVENVNGGFQAGVAFSAVITTTFVPEPSSLALATFGLLGMGYCRRMRT